MQASPTHLVGSEVVRGVVELFGVDTEDLANVDVGALGVDLGVVAVEDVLGHAVHLLDPLAGVTSNDSVDLGAVHARLAEADLSVGDEVVAGIVDLGVVHKGKLEGRNTVLRGCARKRAEQWL